MGLFKPRPTETVVNVRDDISDALDDLPPKELAFIVPQGAPELEYLSDFLRDDEEVVAMAQCRSLQSGSVGVIVYTENRAVAVIGMRDKRSNAVGAPDVYIFPFADLTSLTYASSKQLCVGYFDLRDRPRVTLYIGWDKDWRVVFMDAMKEQYNWSLR